MVQMLLNDRHVDVNARACGHFFQPDDQKQLVHIDKCTDYKGIVGSGSYKLWY
jgi:hypothetical protein